MASKGLNFIDTATSFRKQRAERVVGHVLNTLFQKYGFERENFFLLSKCGIIVVRPGLTTLG